MLKNNIKYIFIPIPSNISYWWNFGSLLGLCLIIQIISGFFLTLFYRNSTILAFESIIYINKDINLGWIIRSIHANGANIFFFIVYFHIRRNIIYFSFLNKYTWSTGIIILLLLFITAFLGYVLPWGQIRFWGATVITSLVTSIPYAGLILTNWIWGGFNVNSSTLTRFFRIHYILPFIIIIFSCIHLIFLHKFRSRSYLINFTNLDKIPFNPYFIQKDLNRTILIIIFIINIRLIFPYIIIDRDNFIKANPIITPIHIQPEWYFLFAYTILRRVPNKIGGVLALISAILILFLLNFIKSIKYNNFNFKYLYLYLFNWWAINWFLF